MGILGVLGVIAIVAGLAALFGIVDIGMPVAMLLIVAGVLLVVFYGVRGRLGRRG